MSSGDLEYGRSQTWGHASSREETQARRDSQHTEDVSISSAWRRAQAEQAFWQAHRAELTERYPDQFVAVLDGHVVATGSDLESLVAGLAAKGLTPQAVWIRFLATTRPMLIL